MARHVRAGPNHLPNTGAILKIEIIEGRGLTIGKAAELLGVTRPTLSNIINGKAAITPNIALRLETVFWATARIWLRLQTSYDLFLAKGVFMEKQGSDQY